MSTRIVTCYIIIANLIHIHSAYWVSQNNLTWSQASTYCQLHCGSELASIHNNSQHILSQTIISNQNGFNSSAGLVHNFWIGLSTSGSDTNYTWSDSSPFNYGNILPHTTPPWSSAPISNNGNDCVFYDHSVLWSEGDCTTLQRFMCNSCEGKLDKYILHDTESEIALAQDDCGYSRLASISSQEDFISSQTLCQVSGNDCWIGLDRLQDTSSPLSFDLFDWRDGSKFSSSLDYGYGSTGVIPWGNTGGDQPDGNGNCVAINSSQGYEWDDMDCANTIYFLCNALSEFYYPSNWVNLFTSKTDFGYVDGEITSSDSGTALIANKRWTNDNWPLIIEYSFTIDTATTNDVDSKGFVGVVIYHKEDGIEDGDHGPCDPHFIGAEIQNGTGNEAYGVYREFVQGGDKIWYERFTTDVADQPTSIFTIDTNQLYKLIIRINNTYENEDQLYFCYKFLGIMQDEECYYDQYSHQFENDYLTSPKYIGITNGNLAVTHKSLYISGTPQYNYGQFPLITCGSNVTLNPTTNPTQSLSPTTQSPSTFEPTASPKINSISTSTPTTSIPTSSFPANSTVDLECEYVLDLEYDTVFREGLNPLNKCIYYYLGLVHILYLTYILFSL